ncbi:hypothetical protein EIP86_001189 [Pleurotus ostreatoroseus]|nr:hypothetical protein EIP86_001189 [Pleurotus ostreatoroseus]
MNIRVAARLPHTVPKLFKALHKAASRDTVHRDLRALLRETAQPVAVVTSLMPPSHISSSSPHSRFHGATLSSFTSIAMDPHPLVAFSLRIPSRMATTLRNAHATPHDWPAATHLVVNILSAAQARVAVQFSRVDRYPRPFEEVPYTLSEEGLPVLEGALGALSCNLVASSWPLHDLDSLRNRARETDAAWEGDGVASELFIAEVTRVEAVKYPEEDDESLRTPLIYHRRAYATTCDIPTPSDLQSGKPK